MKVGDTAYRLDNGQKTFIVAISKTSGNCWIHPQIGDDLHPWFIGEGMKNKGRMDSNELGTGVRMVLTEVAINCWPWNR